MGPQSDLGTAMICVVGILAVMWLGEVPLRTMLIVIGVVVALGLVGIFGSSYRRDRLMVFMNPWNDGEGGFGTGFQLIHSLYALSGGGLFGVGLGNSHEKYLYLTQADTDFIFAIIGEELGLVGAAVVIALFLLLALLVGTSAYRAANDVRSSSDNTRLGLSLIANSIRPPRDRRRRRGRRSRRAGARADRTPGNGDYETRLYAYQGAIVEEYTRAGTAFTPEKAREIVRSSTFDFTYTDGLLTVHTDQAPPRLPAQRKRRCLMGIDLSRLRRGNDHDRRPWHGAAFIVEALVLLVFLIASLAVIMQVIAGAHERSIEATACRTPSSSHRTTPKRSRPIRPAATRRRVRPRRRPAGTTRGADRRPRQERVRLDAHRGSQSQPGGTLYTAHIYVSCGGEATYQIDTARYVSNEGVQR